MWAICTQSDIEEAYEAAIEMGNPNPGGDEAVISDEMILSVVKDVWP